MNPRQYDWGDFTPYDHQKTIFEQTAEREVYALLMEQRTGKTPIVIHTATYLYETGRINGALIVCPNYIKDVWADQWAEHGPERAAPNLLVWNASNAKVFRQASSMVPGPRLNVLVMNEEAFSTGKGKEIAERFLTIHKALWALDESTSIATWTAKRTKAMLKLAPLAKYRRILTGTPLTRGALDLYPQFRFLDVEILGFSSYYGFRNRFCILGGFKGKEVVGYVDVEDIQRRIAPYSVRVLRSDVRDMPPKVFLKLPCQMTPDQRRIYEGLRDEMLAEWSGRRLETTSVLTQMLRLQQVTGGFAPSEVWEEEDGEVTVRKLDAERIPGANPKLDALLGYIGDMEPDDKVVVFSRFRAEIAAITVALEGKFGDGSVVQYHGGVGREQRHENLKAFQADGGARFFVASQPSARMGIDLSKARVVVYYSNTFSFLDRVQSEDRTEKLDSTNSTTYVDLVMQGTIDTKSIIPSLRAKKSMSDIVTGDKPLAEWI